MIKKLQSKKAFTLMEMLIVVAIIGILVAIAIPTFTNALTKAKEAADLANVRAAYAQVVLDNMLNDEPLSDGCVAAAIGELGATLNYADKLDEDLTNKELTVTYTLTTDPTKNLILKATDGIAD